MKNLFFGAVLFIMLASPGLSVGQEITLTAFFEEVVGLQDAITEMRGDSSHDFFMWRVSSQKDSTLFLEKGGNVLVSGIAWYRITFIEERVIIMWSSSVGRIWLPAGNVTLLPKKHLGWQLVSQDQMEVPSEYLQNLLKKIKTE